MSAARIVHRPAVGDRASAFLRWLYAGVFHQIHIDGADVERIRAAAARGPVVYVLPAVSYIAYLYLGWACARHGLPPLRFANGGWRTILLWPLHAALAVLGGLVRLARRAQLEAGEDAVQRHVAAGDSGLVFLRPARLAGVDEGEAKVVRGRYFEALLAAQRELELRGQAVQLVPLTLVLGHPTVRKRKKDGASVRDLLFGEAEAPGRFRATIQVLFWASRGSQVKVGEVIDLGAFLDAEGETARSDEARARALRFVASGAIERERRVLMGPPVKSASRTRLDVLRSRRVVETIDALAAAPDGPSRARLLRRAEALVREIAAYPRRWAFTFFKWGIAFFLDRMYEGVDVDVAGLERVREAARRGPLVLMPSHRSHVDYLILSYVFYLHDLVPPHIAAGKNLAFFPMGAIFRRAGAFFLRRSFKGDALYAAVFESYVRRLLRDHHSVEFFVEGGRSRTGKVLPPRFGLLSICADAALDGDAPAAQAVPIAISYEKVVEEKSYEAEAAGATKERESFGALLKAGEVFSARYGRIEVAIGEPFSLRDALAPDGEVPAGAARRRAVQRLGHRVTWEIAQATAIMPSALLAAAALASPAGSLTEAELLRRVHLVGGLIERRDARFAASLVRDFDAAIAENLTRMSSDGDLDVRGHGDERVVVVPSERRPRLEYYKNTLVHALADVAIVARAIACAGPDATLATVRGHAQAISRLLKLELVFRPGVAFAAAFDGGLSALVEHGAITVDGESLTAGPQHGDLVLLAGLLESYVESYAVAFAAAGERAADESRKDTVAAMLAHGERALLRGEIQRTEALSRPVFETALEALGLADARAGGAGREAYAADLAAASLPGRV